MENIYSNNNDYILKKQNERIFREIVNIAKEKGINEAIKETNKLKNRNELFDKIIQFLLKKQFSQEHFSVYDADRIISSLQDIEKKDELRLGLMNILSERSRFDDVEELYHKGFISNPHRIALAKNYTAMNYLKNGMLEKASSYLVQSIRNIELIEKDEELKELVSMRVEETVKKMKQISEEEKDNQLLNKVLIAFFLLLMYYKKANLMYKVISLSPPPSSSSGEWNTLDSYNISKIQCDIFEKDKDNHKVYKFDFKSENQKLNTFGYLLIAYKDDILIKESLEDCNDYFASYTYEDIDIKIELPNKMEIFIIPKEGVKEWISI
jgi:hypothetical protein